MRRTEKISIFLILSLVLTFSSLSFAAWPIFEMPPGDPKANQSIRYLSDMSIRDYTKYFYDNKENLLTEVEYDDPGNDGIWFNGDDIVDEFEVYTYDSDNNRIMNIDYDSAGPDGIPLTDDDVIERYFKYLYDANGDMYRSIKYTSPGTDGEWFTKDDSVSSYDEITYYYDNLIVRDIDYDGPGLDNEWFTSDDSIEEYDNMYFYSNFRQYNEKDYIGAGPDGIWFNNDDIQREEDDFTYDSNWNLTKWIETEINVDVEETTYYYDSNNNCSRIISKKDNVIRGYLDFIYDENSRRREDLLYNSPGSDEIWFTPDDTWYYKIVYDYLPPSQNGTAIPWIPLLLLSDDIDLNMGLVAHYPFNGNANDASGNGNHGTEVGGVNYVNGVIGQAVSLDGVEDWIHVGDVDDLDGQQQLTISAKINRYSETSNQIVTKHDSCVGGYDNFSFRFGSEEKLGFQINETWSLDTRLNALTTSPVALINEWQHVAVVFDGSQPVIEDRIRIFHNGIEQDISLTLFYDVTRTPANTKPLRIGASRSSTCNHFPFAGAIDEVRLYNRALSAAEIQELYNLGN